MILQLKKILLNNNKKLIVSKREPESKTQWIEKLIAKNDPLTDYFDDDAVIEDEEIQRHWKDFVDLLKAAKAMDVYEETFNFLVPDICEPDTEIWSRLILNLEYEYFQARLFIEQACQID